MQEFNLKAKHALAAAAVVAVLLWAFGAVPQAGPTGLFVLPLASNDSLMAEKQDYPIGGNVTVFYSGGPVNISITRPSGATDILEANGTGVYANAGEYGLYSLHAGGASAYFCVNSTLSLSVAPAKPAFSPMDVIGIYANVSGAPLNASDLRLSVATPYGYSFELNFTSIGEGLFFSDFVLVENIVLGEYRAEAAVTKPCFSGSNSTGFSISPEKIFLNLTSAPAYPPGKIRLFAAPFYSNGTPAAEPQFGLVVLDSQSQKNILFPELVPAGGGWYLDFSLRTPGAYTAVVTALEGGSSAVANATFGVSEGQAYLRARPQRGFVGVPMEIPLFNYTLPLPENASVHAELSDPSGNVLSFSTGSGTMPTGSGRLYLPFTPNSSGAHGLSVRVFGGAALLEENNYSFMVYSSEASYSAALAPRRVFSQPGMAAEFRINFSVENLSSGAIALLDAGNVSVSVYSYNGTAVDADARITRLSAGEYLLRLQAPGQPGAYDVYAAVSYWNLTFALQAVVNTGAASLRPARGAYYSGEDVELDVSFPADFSDASLLVADPSNATFQIPLNGSGAYRFPLKSAVVLGSYSAFLSNGSQLLAETYFDVKYRMRLSRYTRFFDKKGQALESRILLFRGGQQFFDSDADEALPDVSGRFDFSVSIGSASASSVFLRDLQVGGSLESFLNSTELREVSGYSGTLPGGATAIGPLLFAEVPANFSNATIFLKKEFTPMGLYHCVSFDNAPANCLLWENYSAEIGQNDSYVWFDVPSFTGYAYGSNTNLTVWDEADAGMPFAGLERGAGSQVLFFANYTNSTGSPVRLYDSTADCNITFNTSGPWDPWAQMPWNSSRELFEYNRSFPSAGTFTWQANCSSQTNALLVQNDTVSILNSSSLSVWVLADPAYYPNRTFFYANYTNGSSPVTNATCTWSDTREDEIEHSYEMNHTIASIDKTVDMNGTYVRIHLDNASTGWTDNELSFYARVNGSVNSTGLLKFWFRDDTDMYTWWTSDAPDAALNASNATGRNLTVVSDPAWSSAPNIPLNNVSWIEAGLDVSAPIERNGTLYVIIGDPDSGPGSHWLLAGDTTNKGHGHLWHEEHSHFDDVGYNFFVELEFRHPNATMAYNSTSWLYEHSVLYRDMEKITQNENLRNYSIACTGTGFLAQSKKSNVTIEDSVLPNVTITSLSPTVIYPNASVSVSWTTSDTIPLTYSSCHVHNPSSVTLYTTEESPFSFSNTSAGGTYTAHCNVTDQSGNNAEMEQTFLVDSYPPVVAVQSPANGSLNPQQNLSLSFTASDNSTLDWCGYSLNGAANATLSSCTGTHILAQVGWNNVTVYANDTGGHMGNSSFIQFQVESQAPSDNDPWRLELDPAFTALPYLPGLNVTPRARVYGQNKSELTANLTVLWRVFSVNGNAEIKNGTAAYGNGMWNGTFLNLSAYANQYVRVSMAVPLFNLSEVNATVNNSDPVSYRSAYLNAHVIPGTVTIYFNGSNVSGYSIDHYSGYVHFVTPYIPTATTNITATYNYTLAVEEEQTFYVQNYENARGIPWMIDIQNTSSGPTANASRNLSVFIHYLADSARHTPAVSPIIKYANRTNQSSVDLGMEDIEHGAYKHTIPAGTFTNGDDYLYYATIRKGDYDVTGGYAAGTPSDTYHGIAKSSRFIEFRGQIDTGIPSYWDEERFLWFPQEGQNVSITTHFGDNAEDYNISIVMRYRLNQGNWTGVNVTRDPQYPNMVEGIIPSSYAEDHIEHYFYANDSAGNEITTPVNEYVINTAAKNPTNAFMYLAKAVYWGGRYSGGNWTAKLPGDDAASNIYDNVTYVGFGDGTVDANVQEFQEFATIRAYVFVLDERGKPHPNLNLTAWIGEESQTNSSMVNGTIPKAMIDSGNGQYEVNWRAFPLVNNSPGTPVSQLAWAEPSAASIWGRLLSRKFYYVHVDYTGDNVSDVKRRFLAYTVGDTFFGSSLAGANRDASHCEGDASAGGSRCAHSTQMYSEGENRTDNPFCSDCHGVLAVPEIPSPWNVTNNISQLMQYSVRHPRANFSRNLSQRCDNSQCHSIGRKGDQPAFVPGYGDGEYNITASYFPNPSQCVGCHTYKGGTGKIPEYLGHNRMIGCKFCHAEYHDRNDLVVFNSTTREGTPGYVGSGGINGSGTYPATCYQNCHTTQTNHSALGVPSFGGNASVICMECHPKLTTAPFHEPDVRPYSDRKTCGSCHQKDNTTLTLHYLQSLNPPKITDPVRSGKLGDVWNRNGTPAYWVEVEHSCRYCHGRSYNQPYGLGRIQEFRSEQMVLNTTAEINQSNRWCASCHVQSWTSGNKSWIDMVNVYKSALNRVPPEITGNETYKSDRPGYRSHNKTFENGDISDHRCWDCHKGTYPVTVGMDLFVHNVTPATNSPELTESGILIPGSSETETVQNESFVLYAFTECVKYDCGYVRAYARYNSSSSSADTYMSSSTPFSVASNPLVCSSFLYESKNCTVAWNVTAKGSFGTRLAIDVRFFSTWENVTEESTQDIYVTITTPAPNVSAYREQPDSAGASKNISVLFAVFHDPASRVNITGANLTDDYPDGWAVQSLPAGASDSNGTVTIPLGSLPIGSLAIVNYTITSNDSAASYNFSAFLNYTYDDVLGTHNKRYSLANLSTAVDSTRAYFDVDFDLVSGGGVNRTLLTNTTYTANVTIRNTGSLDVNATYAPMVYYWKFDNSTFNASDVSCSGGSVVAYGGLQAVKCEYNSFNISETKSFTFKLRSPALNYSGLQISNSTYDPPAAVVKAMPSDESKSPDGLVPALAEQSNPTITSGASNPAAASPASGPQPGPAASTGYAPSLEAADVSSAVSGFLRSIGRLLGLVPTAGLEVVSEDERGLRTPSAIRLDGAPAGSSITLDKGASHVLDVGIGPASVRFEKVSLEADAKARVRLVPAGKYLGRLPPGANRIDALLLVEGPLSFSQAAVSLPITSQPNLIFRCDGFDYGSGNCNSWERGPSFSYNGTHVSFSVSSFSGYAHAPKPDVAFDRDFSCQKCGKHKVPPITDINISITASFSGTITNATLADHFPADWIVVDPNIGKITSLNSTHNRIEWLVPSATGSASASYILMSPQRTIPPSKFYFSPEFAAQPGDGWLVLVADPTFSAYGYHGHYAQPSATLDLVSPPAGAGQESVLISVTGSVGDNSLANFTSAAVSAPFGVIINGTVSFSGYFIAGTQNRAKVYWQLVNKSAGGENVVCSTALTANIATSLTLYSGTCTTTNYLIQNGNQIKVRILVNTSNTVTANNTWNTTSYDSTLNVSAVFLGNATVNITTPSASANVLFGNSFNMTCNATCDPGQAGTNVSCIGTNVSAQYFDGSAWSQIGSSGNLTLSAGETNPHSLGDIVNGTQANTSFSITGNIGGLDYQIRCGVVSQYSNPLNGTTARNVSVLGFMNASISPSASQTVFRNNSLLVNCTVGCYYGPCASVVSNITYYNSTKWDLVPTTPIGQLYSNSSGVSLGTIGTNSTATAFYNVTFDSVSSYNIRCLFNSSLPSNVSANLSVSSINRNISIALDYPGSAYTVGQNTTFILNATVSCNGGCGQVNASARFNQSSPSPDTAMNTTLGATPFQVSSNPVTCSQSLGDGQSCTVSWSVNATGAPFTGWYVDISASSSDSEITAVNSSDSLITIVDKIWVITQESHFLWVKYAPPAAAQFWVLNVSATNRSGLLFGNASIRIYSASEVLEDSGVLNSTAPARTPSLPDNTTYRIEFGIPLASGGMDAKILGVSLSANTSVAPQIADSYAGGRPVYIRNITAVFALNDSGLSYTRAELYFPASFTANKVLHCTAWNFSSANCSAWQANRSSDYNMQQNSTHVWFNVTGFTAYAGGFGYDSNLTIWDETDSGMPYAGYVRYPGQQVRFFSNYTNSTSGAAITGASCSINFSGSSASMPYNSSTLLYEYNRSFSTAGTYNWNSSCSAAGFDSLNATDSVLITANTPPKVTNVYPGNSSLQWFHSSPLNVSWNATDPDGDSINGSELQYSNDSGSLWQPLANASGSSPSFGWRIRNMTSFTKQPGNPVLAPAQGWDTWGIGGQSVLYNGSHYLMWYFGTNDAGWNTNFSIGLATSTDGISWTEYSANPLLNFTEGTWEDQVRGMSVVYENGVYKMWYTGLTDTNLFAAIGFANSTDGIAWSKYSGNPVIPTVINGPDVDEAADPTVLHIADTYHMWYTLGYYRSASGKWLYNVSYATSPDGLAWTKRGVVLSSDGGEGIDSNGTSQPAVVFDNSEFKLLYAGFNLTGHGKIMYATSENGLNWTKHGTVLPQGAGGEWDSYYASAPDLLIINRTWKIWYRGWNNSVDYPDRIGFANATDWRIGDNSTYKIRARSKDTTNGSFGEWNQSLYDFGIDTIPPNSSDNAPAGWQTSAVTVNFSCSDSLSGCNSTYYRIDSGSWASGSSVAVSTNGNHTLEYYSLDNAGNNETMQYSLFRSSLPRKTYVAVNMTVSLSASLNTPAAGSTTTKAQYGTFTVNATVTCTGACGNVNGTVRYNYSSAQPDTKVNTTAGDVPAYTLSGNPQSCGSLSNGQSCSLQWTVNATGLASYLLDVNFTSAEASARTGNFTLVINAGGASALPSCGNATLSYRITNSTDANYLVRMNLTSGNSTANCSAYAALFLPNNNTASPQAGSGFDMNGTAFSDRPAMNSSNTTVSGGYEGFVYWWQFNFTGTGTVNISLNVTGYNDYRASDIFAGVDPLGMAHDEAAPHIGAVKGGVGHLGMGAKGRIYVRLEYLLEKIRDALKELAEYVLWR